jgi:hypothetical protein
MTRRRSATIVPAVARSIGVAFAVTIAICGPALGASAEPSADPGAGPDETNIEAWLDIPIPADLPIGERYGFGVTMWDTQQQRFAEFNQAFIRLHPAKGSATPTVGEANSDWPGHLIGDVEVPQGGAGRLEIGLSEKVCTIRGSVQTCDQQEFPFRLAGTGPPPDAPRTALVVATTVLPPGSLLAGEPIDLLVTVEAQAMWDIATLALPDQLFAFVNERGGPDLAATTLRPSREGGSSSAIAYTGQITVADPGEVTLQVAIPGNGTADQVLSGATTRLRIGGTAVDGSPRPAAVGPASPAGEGVPWLPVGVAALVIAGGLVIRKVFADL